MAQKNKDILKQYLGQHYMAQKKKKQLQQRLVEFRAQMTGTKAMEYSDMPKALTPSTGSQTEALIIKAEEIEARIREQIAICNETMVAVMDILDFLPQNSLERIIMEYRHIDCYSWERIMKSVNLSRTPCNLHYNIGVEKLLSEPRVAKLLEGFEPKI